MLDVVDIHTYYGDSYLGGNFIQPYGRFFNGAELLSIKITI